jgi:hypothetical protein
MHFHAAATVEELNCQEGRHLACCWSSRLGKRHVSARSASTPAAVRHRARHERRQRCVRYAHSVGTCPRLLRPWEYGKPSLGFDGGQYFFRHLPFMKLLRKLMVPVLGASLCAPGHRGRDQEPWLPSCLGGTRLRGRRRSRGLGCARQRSRRVHPGQQERPSGLCCRRGRSRLSRKPSAGGGPAAKAFGVYPTRKRNLDVPAFVRWYGSHRDFGRAPEPSLRHGRVADETRLRLTDRRRLGRVPSLGGSLRLDEVRARLLVEQHQPQPRTTSIYRALYGNWHSVYVHRIYTSL